MGRGKNSKSSRAGGKEARQEAQAETFQGWFSRAERMGEVRAVMEKKGSCCSIEASKQEGEGECLDARASSEEGEGDQRALAV
eukprot:2739817-Rhodomonas_salina.1